MQKDYLLENYNYILPPEAIAQEPHHPAHNAKLLIVEKGSDEYQHQTFLDLSKELWVHDVLLFNNSKVFKARIPLHEQTILRRSWIKKVIDGEIFVYRIIDTQHLECLVSDDKNFKPGAQIFFSDEIILHSIKYTENWILFKLVGDSSLEFLERFGQMPLPPYIHYSKEKEQWYQTHFAQEIGSAAAPTASLHFTPELLNLLKQQWVEISFSLLHVGLGTFKPVYVQDIRDHPIHQETMIVEWNIFEKIFYWKRGNKNIIPVWTTMVRFLETLPYLWKTLVLYNPLSQERFKKECCDFWNTLTQDISPEVCKDYIKDFSLQENFISIETTLFIYPGFVFRIIDEMITNFHLPKSSLLMLVSALLGREEALKSYEEAIKKGYLFYSFGDGMWIKKKPRP